MNRLALADNDRAALDTAGTAPGCDGQAVSSKESHRANAAEGVTDNREIRDWVESIARHTRPERIHWCDGSDDEWQQLTQQMVADGSLIELNKDLRPNSFLARSHPSDVARVEERTFICSQNEADAGPTNNWVDPAEMKNTLNEVFDGCMAGRTMYVVPFAMGPIGGAMTQYGIQLTDSPYAVLNMRIMTRAGQKALDAMVPGTTWVRTVHSAGGGR